MSSIFKNANKEKNISEHSVLESRYNSGVANLLAVVGFSLVNVVLLVLNSNTYFLFSACIPYVLADFGMAFCGLYPEEYYYDFADTEFLDKSFLVLMLALAAVVILLFFICWFFARKKKVGWLIFALVLFAIDTVAMFYFYGFSADNIMDIVFHAWVLFSLGNSIFAYKKLKNLPQEEPEEVVETPQSNDISTPQINDVEKQFENIDI